ncbi:MAG: hypothetical protein NVSMB42_10600 [Herpetosiphon sp.]
MANRDAASVVRTFIQAWAQRRMDEAARLLAADVRWVDVPLERTLEGADSWRRGMEAWFRAFPDLAFAITMLQANDGEVMAQLQARGTHRGPWIGATGIEQATGTPVKIDLLLVMRLEGGRISSVYAYYEMPTLGTAGNHRQ